MSGISAIIVSAGSGSRMGKNTNKQFLELLGMPVFMHSVIAFSNVLEVLEIIIVAREEDLPRMKSIVCAYNIVKPVKFVVGGEERQDSVKNGFEVVGDTEYVAVHDGARPLITVKDIKRVIADAKKHGASTLGVRVKDTIKIVDALNNIVDTPDRATLYSIQTPQVFKSDLYFVACNYAEQNHYSFTDDCQLFEALGLSVYLTVGNYENIKITTPEDIFLAQRIMVSRAKGQ